MKRILVTGATGQIGTELTRELRRSYGVENVVASCLRRPGDDAQREWAPFEQLDVTDRPAIDRVLDQYQIDTMFHLAAVLSVVGEQNPQLAWDVNVNGLHNVLEAARTRGVKQVFWPSSIAVFGPDAPRINTPQNTSMHPTTLYGVSKVTGELLCDYYVDRYGLDVRSLRYPGVISSDAPPGGGTTDYAVAIFYEAIKQGCYTCFVREDTVLPMVYMPDCIQAAMGLMDADPSRLTFRNGFNLGAMSFSVGELASEIKKHIPHFEILFEPDHRQTIADSWPQSLDDSAARQQWGWQPNYGLPEMTVDMLEQLSVRNEQGMLQ